MHADNESGMELGDYPKGHQSTKKANVVRFYFQALSTRSWSPRGGGGGGVYKRGQWSSRWELHKFPVALTRQLVCWVSCQCMWVC